MARALKRLTHRTVETLKSPGRHADGEGLYLQVDDSGAKRWVFVFQWKGKRKEMGLGPVSLVSLAEAREEKQAARKTVRNGLNPIDERRKAKALDSSATFGAFFEAWLPHNEAAWKNPKHRQQWRSTLQTHAAGLWDIPVRSVTVEDVLAVLRPIWATKAETASRLRGRIERVLDAAKAQGYRAGENPARWKGHLDAILPRPRKLARGHHPAMPFADVPALMARLAKSESLSAKALQFTILTAARTSEVLNARWSEMDLKAKVWTIPEERMKAGREHRVPLTTAAIVAMGEPRGPEDWVFPGTKNNGSLTNMAMTAHMRRMGLGNFTVHGFRSSFRDWAGETTAFPRELVELALAHNIGDATERAYRRGDSLERRRNLMVEWERFAATV